MASKGRRMAEEPKEKYKKIIIQNNINMEHMKEI